jgi:hypothetical protein
MSQTKVHSLVESLGDMISVHLMCFGHDRHRRLRVSFRHCVFVCRVQALEGMERRRASNRAVCVFDGFESVLRSYCSRGKDDQSLEN